MKDLEALSMSSWIPHCQFLHAKSLLEHVEDVSKLHMSMRCETRYSLNGGYLGFRRTHCMWQPTVCGIADDQDCFMDKFSLFGFGTATLGGKFVSRSL